MAFLQRHYCIFVLLITFEYFICKGSSRTLSLVRHRDGINNCPDGSDETTRGGGLLFVADLTLGTIQVASFSYFDIFGLNFTTIPFSTTIRPIAVEFDPNIGTVFWSENGNIKRGDLDGSNEFTLHDSAPVPDGLALDLIDQRVYWSDTETDQINSISYDGNIRQTIIDSALDQPRAIVIHQVLRVMFWSDWGSQPKIERADLTGANRQTLVETRLVWPNGLAFNNEGTHLYWIEGSLGHLEVVDLFGANRRTILSTGIDHPFDLAVLGTNFVWTDWTYGALGFSSTNASFNGALNGLYEEFFSRPGGIHISQDIDDCPSPDPCMNGGTCSDSIHGYTCDCTGTGFEGSDCTMDIDDCNPDPCMNGGTCSDDINGYNCDCNGTGFQGSDCNESLINPNNVSVSATEIVIHWTLTEDTVGLFDRCTAYITGDCSTRSMDISTEPPVTISGLQPETEYSFLINCSNSSGIYSHINIPPQTTLKVVPSRPSILFQDVDGIGQFSFEVNVPSYDESNGQISCFEFIVVQLRNSLTSVDPYDNAQSNVTDYSTIDNHIETSFSAMVLRTIPVDNTVTIGSLTEVQSECIMGEGPLDDERRIRRGIVKTSTLRATSGPLIAGGYYTCFLRVYAPTGRDGEFYYVDGPAMKPVKLKDAVSGRNTHWSVISMSIIITGLILLNIITIIIVSVYIYKRKRSDRAKDEPASTPIHTKPTDQSDVRNQYHDLSGQSEDVYQNVDSVHEEDEYEMVIFKGDMKKASEI